MSKKILVVDDEIEICELLKVNLTEQLNCEVDIAANGMEALNLTEKMTYDLVITDYKMPYIDGAGLIEAIKLTENPYKDTPIFLISGHLSNPKEGPDIIRDVLFFEKPIIMEKLIRYCNFALKSRGQKASA